MINRTIKQKISKGIEGHSTINQKDLFNMYRTLHPTIEKYTFFSSAHGAYSKISSRAI